MKRTNSLTNKQDTQIMELWKRIGLQGINTAVIPDDKLPTFVNGVKLLIAYCTGLITAEQLAEKINALVK